ncbi:MAG: hypothetical protein EUB_00664 [Eubacterium sp.]|uniref:MATE family efflux transporter n=1 Tax=Eubacterium sp. TaxID=142586 RepID=UPI0030661B0D
MFERKGNIIEQQFMKFFFPTVLMTMALSLSTVVDGIIVGNILGPDALAAVNLVLPITLLFNSVYVLVGVGGATLYSVALGKREKEYAKQLFTLSVLAMALVSAVIFVLGLFICRPLAEILTANAQNLTELVFDYMRVVMLAAPFLILAPGLVYFLRSTGEVKLASSVLIIANVVNLTLDVVYIVFLKTGIGGAALATGTGYLVGLFVALFGIYRAKELRFCRVPDNKLKTLIQIMSTGLPMTINTALNFFRLTCINAIVMVYLGSNGVTAFSVCTSCLSIVSMFVGGSAQTMIPLLGTLYGERDIEGVRFTIRKAIAITGTATLILLFFFETIPVQITSLFGVTDPVQISIAVEAIRIYAISLPFMGLLFISICVYQVMGYQSLSSVVAFLEGFAIVVPAAWILSKIFGAVGIWAAFPVGEILTIICIFIYTKTVRKKNPNASGFFLIEKERDETMLDVTLSQEAAQVVGLSDAAIRFCIDNGIDKTTAGRVGVVLEEMAVNTIENQPENRRKKKKQYIDIRLILEDEAISIIFKDNGYPMDPLKTRETQNQFSNLAVAEAVSSDIAYDYILGMNCSVVKINK